MINVYCHPGELKEHKKNWKGLVNSIQEYGKECKNQSEARDYIIKKCKSKYVIFLDDNLRFQTRLPSKNKLSGSCNELISKNYNDKTILKEQTNIFFFLISNLRKGYGMTGISFRPFNRIKKEDFEENSKIFAIWGLNVPLYKKISVRLSDFELKEDYAINLALLQSGYKNIVSFYYAFDKTSGANSEGGDVQYLEQLKNLMKVL